MKRLRTATGDAGIGLVELLVAMALGSILLIALGTTFAGSLRTTSRATTQVSNTAEMRLGLDTVARHLRLAVSPSSASATLKLPSFEAATPTSVRFYASLTTPGSDADPAPTLVEYSVTGTCLQEARTRPVVTATGAWSWTDPAAVRTTTCLVRGAVTGDGGALFSYFGAGAYAAGSFPTSSPVGPALGDPVTGVDAAVLGDIRSVQVSAALQSSATSSTPAVRASTRVTLVNLYPAA